MEFWKQEQDVREIPEQMGLMGKKLCSHKCSKKETKINAKFLLSISLYYLL
jgi:hypothetical protein